MYRDRLKGVQILLSNCQAGPGRKVKQDQEEISRNHVPRLFLGSVHTRHHRTDFSVFKRPISAVGVSGHDITDEIKVTKKDFLELSLSRS